jgi:hypothetical protein
MNLLESVDLGNNGYARFDCLSASQRAELPALLAAGVLVRRGNCILRPATVSKLAGSPEFTPQAKPMPVYDGFDYEAAILSRQAAWID